MPNHVRSGLDRGFASYAILLFLDTIAAWTYTFVTKTGELHVSILIGFAFVTLGMLVKYGDEAFDVNLFSKRKTIALAVPGGVLMGGLMLYDINSATIFSGLLLALLLAGKYDNYAFRVGFVAAGSLALLTFMLAPSSLNVIGVAAVFAAALVDEWVSDRVDKRGIRNIADRIFLERPFLKGAVLALCLLGILTSLLYFFLFLGFDFGYSLVERYGHARAKVNDAS